VTVDVLNGTDVRLLATRNAAALRDLGFHTNLIDSTSAPAQASLVEYPAGREAQAKAVAAVVPHAKPVLTPDVTRVTVILGADGHWVQGVARPAHSAGGGGAGHAAKDPTGGLGCID